MVEELKGPSLFEIKQSIQEKNWVEFCTVNDKTLKGQILWFDINTFHLILEDGKEVTLLRQSIIYYSILKS